MSGNRRTRRKAAEGTAPAAETLLGEGQRRVVFALAFSGLALALVGLLMPARGATYWVAFFAALAGAGLAGFLAAGRSGRALDAWLLVGGQPRQAPRAAAPADLPEPARQALRIAMLPALLAELAGAAERMPPRCQAAARALVETGATAPAGDALDTLAADLPRLLPALAEGGTAAAAEAEALAQRLARPAGGAA
jgi:hypothetical protein